MKILIADKFDASGIEKLKSLNCQIAYEPGTTQATMSETIAAEKPEALIVRSTKVDAAAIGACEELSLIVRAGAGYDTIDVDEASRRGIYVANCPGKNSVAVAELAWGLILACDRRIPDQTADLRRGTWNKKEYSQAKGLKGGTLGVIGTGQIGMNIARRGKAFGMNVIGWSRSLTSAKASKLGVGFCESLQELAKQSDVVSVSVAANDETKHLIGAEFVSAMKPGATLVNTSRGSVVDQSALAQGIQEKGIRAGLDVFADEPGSSPADFGDTIVQLPGVYGTHHVGASTDQAQTSIAREAVRIIENFMVSGEVCNCVNLASRTAATSLITVRHLNEPGVLAHVFDVLDEAKINVEEMENVIYQGAKAACAKIQIAAQLSESDLNRIREHGPILAVSQTEIGN